MTLIKTRLRSVFDKSDQVSTLWFHHWPFSDNLQLTLNTEELSYEEVLHICLKHMIWKHFAEKKPSVSWELSGKIGQVEILIVQLCVLKSATALDWFGNVCWGSKKSFLYNISTMPVPPLWGEKDRGETMIWYKPPKNGNAGVIWLTCNGIHGSQEQYEPWIRKWNSR